MNTLEAETSPLFALLARQWKFDAELQEVAFSRDGTSVAFARADGVVAIASMHDPEAAAIRWRMSIEDGRSTISRRSHTVERPMECQVDRASVRLAPFGPSGFLVGGASGRFVHLGSDGHVCQTLQEDGPPIEALAISEDCAAWVAAGGQVTRHDPLDMHIEASFLYEGSARSLAASPDGTALAIGLDDRVLIVPRSTDAKPFAIATDTITALCWAPDGKQLAVGTTSSGLVLLNLADRRALHLPDYPARVSRLSWSADSHCLVTNGAFRTIVWSVTAPDAKPTTIATGHPGTTIVAAARIHPRLPLVATGYDNGMIAVMAIGQRDEVIVRDPGPGGIHDLIWSPDGEHLAFQASQGWGGVIDLPSHMFKSI